MLGFVCTIRFYLIICGGMFPNTCSHLFVRYYFPEIYIMGGRFEYMSAIWIHKEFFVCASYGCNLHFGGLWLFFCYIWCSFLVIFACVVMWFLYGYLL